MAFSGDMSSLNTNYTSTVNTNLKFIYKIYLYLAATSFTFSGNTSPLSHLAATKILPLKTLFSDQTLAVTFQRRQVAAKYY